MVFEQIMKYDFSVRKVEEIVRELMKPEEEKREKSREETSTYRGLHGVTNSLGSLFWHEGWPETERERKRKIVISFKSDSDLERIVELLDKVDKK